MSLPKHFHFFKQDISTFALPDKFTFPFYYETHPLCDLAAKETQQYISTQQEWIHPFTSNNQLEEKAIGKMFGVLVVQNQENQIGYISSFSGKLAGTNNHNYFVPPVYDMLTQQEFLSEEKVLNSINAKIEKLEQDVTFNELTQLLKQASKKRDEEISELRAQMIIAKSERKKRRTNGKENLATESFTLLVEQLAKESVAAKNKLKRITHEWDLEIEKLKATHTPLQLEITNLKQERKNRSNQLQQFLFSQYTFLNKEGNTKSLLELFKNSPFDIPPAGAGECAAPKLLQYAFKHQLTPICMAEFWWGESPKSEIRKHANYYPACQGKCKPILTHMLEGVVMDENPLLNNPAVGKEITIVYEDEHLVVVNKPEEFLSVPGKTIQDSVYLRMKQKYPNATGPLIVHRLDMSTSGLMLIAKNKDIHEHLQRQFIKREVKKRYVALLNGVPKKEEGYIDLPLRLDINDRPRQLVCNEHGKSARTLWEIIEQKDNKTKVYFYPITGRTHQLRVHAAHNLGLNTPILGDDLYGVKNNRLHLHAEQITFTHPKTKELLTIKAEANF